MEKADILIIGGGIVGSSIAYNLLNDGFRGKIIVFEKDPTYEYASSTLASGGVRQQFANPVNIRIMLYSVPFYENFDEAMAVGGEPAHAEFHQNGYFYLTDENNWEFYNTNYETQKKLGADVQQLTPKQTSDIFNKKIGLEINLEGIKATFFGPRDGRLDPYGVLQGFIKKAKNLGAKYIYDEVTGITVKNHRIEKLMTKKGDAFTGPVVVNAAGPWAQEVGKLAGIHLPVVPTSHNKYVCALTKKFNKRLPMVIFPNRACFMGESESKILCSLRKLEQEPGFIFEWDRDHFMNNVWPKLAERMPLFETLKLERGYAGLYEVTPDECPILGEHPEIKGFYLANGFSGHGVMEAPAIGKLISELIRLGRYETVDAGDFSLDRFEKRKPIIREKSH